MPSLACSGMPSTPVCRWVMPFSRQFLLAAAAFFPLVPWWLKIRAVEVRRGSGARGLGATALVCRPSGVAGQVPAQPGPGAVPTTRFRAPTPAPLPSSPCHAGSGTCAPSSSVPAGWSTGFPGEAPRKWTIRVRKGGLGPCSRADADRGVGTLPSQPQSPGAMMRQHHPLSGAALNLPRLCPGRSIQ